MEQTGKIIVSYITYVVQLPWREDRLSKEAEVTCTLPRKYWSCSCEQWTKWLSKQLEDCAHITTAKEFEKEKHE